ncbi:hypothetical protein MRB53_037922 [Persea americana]|nr:hypothetical protein MRB53_037922 [Persea americana]
MNAPQNLSSPLPSGQGGDGASDADGKEPLSFPFHVVKQGSKSPSPVTGSGMGSPVLFGYPYHRDTRSPMFTPPDAPTATAIQG